MRYGYSGKSLVLEDEYFSSQLSSGSWIGGDLKRGCGGVSFFRTLFVAVDVLMRGRRGEGGCLCYFVFLEGFGGERGGKEDEGGGGRAGKGGGRREEKN